MKADTSTSPGIPVEKWTSDNFHHKYPNDYGIHHNLGKLNTLSHNFNT